MRVILSLVALLSLVVSSAACDGNDEPDRDTIEADTLDDTQDTVEPDTTSDTEVTPLDTALPDFEVIQTNTELRNGVTAWVGHVTDGDTLGVWVGTQSNRKLHVVRMLGLAAPECNKTSRQAPDGARYSCSADDEYYGLASYNELKAMVEDKTVTITCDVAANTPCDSDAFDRRLAYVIIDGKDAAVEMARRGAAFAYTSFSASKRGQICAAEYEARAAKRGMWALGSVSQVLARMSADTRSWYNNHHDRRCDEAMR